MCNKEVIKNMYLSPTAVEQLSEKYGDSFYLLDSAQFKGNYRELQQAFRDIYPNTHIAYSYKTNYTPALCKIVNQLSGYAEVVSAMELEVALRCGVHPSRIFFNGPVKHEAAVERLLTSGGIVNIDALEELDAIRRIAKRHPMVSLKLGLRCNFPVGDEFPSRFGLEAGSEGFAAAVQAVRALPNGVLAGFHCHFANRRLEMWPARVRGMLALVEAHFIDPPQFISLGGGLFGKMAESLKAQFGCRIPDYKEYAEIAATPVKQVFESLPAAGRPELIIEPGTALAGDVMQFVSRVVSIKEIRGKTIATLAGSVYNINPTLNKKNPPVHVIHPAKGLREQKEYVDLDFAGYTCIESDYLYRGYNGQLAVGDWVVFENVGSYSVVLKPPFIWPNFPIIEYNSERGDSRVVKRQETFDDVFHTFDF